MFNKAVAVIIYNRPKHTEALYNCIRQIKPKKLFIIADGPKLNDEDDYQKCEQTRIIFDDIDWNIETVKKNYSKTNMGLKSRVETGLDWVFENIDEAIVLEDDCIPSLEFFEFCSFGLNKYRDDHQIMAITGDNFQNGRWRGDGSYYFSKYNHCWGWATWSRSWKKYDGDLTFWGEWRHTQRWLDLFERVDECRYWTEIFDQVSHGLINSWAYPWTAAVWFNGGITVTPNVNLVQNIGFGPEATNTKSKQNTQLVAFNKLGAIVSPSEIKIDVDADDYVYMQHFGGKTRVFPRSLFSAPIRFLKRIL